MQLANFPFLSSLFLLFNQRPQNEDVIACAEFFPEACLPLGFDIILLSPYHCKQLGNHRTHCDTSVIAHTTFISSRSELQ